MTKMAFRSARVGEHGIGHRRDLVEVQPRPQFVDSKGQVGGDEVDFMPPRRELLAQLRRDHPAAAVTRKT